MSAEDLEDILEKFNTFTQKPAKFLTVQEDAKNDIKNLVKSLYDFTKSQESKKSKSATNALPELIVEEFDEEQVWQQLELKNTECWDNLVWDVASCMTAKNDLMFPIKEPQEPQNDEVEEEDSNAVSDIETENLKTKIKKKLPNLKKKAKSSIVDDNFFNLMNMEKFLIDEEKREGKQQKEDSDEESIDMFDDIPSEASNEDEEDPKAMKYNDFFMDNESSYRDDDCGDDLGDDHDDDRDDDPDDYNQERASNEDSKEKSAKKKKVTFADSGSEEDDDEDEGEESDNSETNTHKLMAGAKSNFAEKKSDFEMRQGRLQDTITRLEKKSISEAPWQLKGEVDASKRPQNSLLQEVVDFDLTTRPPPIITEQTTITLEDIIKQRVKDKAWDDVVKKAKPVEDVLAFRKTEVLDHAKSKQSLAEVYEAEYIKQKQATTGTDENENDKEPEAYTEIRKCMNDVFAKLDALSHYHYTPKAAQPEVKIVSNTPAISMEEVAPVIASSASLLAPEEVKKKTELLSKEERTDTDKKRERRKKKKFQKQKGKVEKVEEHRNTKKAVEASDKSLKTSKAFFQHLNDDSTSLIKLNNAKRKNKNVKK